MFNLSKCCRHSGRRGEGEVMDALFDSDDGEAFDFEEDD